MQQENRNLLCCRETFFCIENCRDKQSDLYSTCFLVLSIFLIINLNTLTYFCVLFFYKSVRRLFRIRITSIPDIYAWLCFLTLFFCFFSVLFCFFSQSLNLYVFSLLSSSSPSQASKIQNGQKIQTEKVESANFSFLLNLKGKSPPMCIFREGVKNKI
jgi:hypothetical protein